MKESQAARDLQARAAEPGGEEEPGGEAEPGGEGLAGEGS